MFISLSIQKSIFCPFLSQYATTALNNIRTVVALGREEYFIQEFEDAFNRNFW